MSIAKPEAQELEGSHNGVRPRRRQLRTEKEPSERERVRLRLRRKILGMMQIQQRVGVRLEIEACSFVGLKTKQYKGWDEMSRCGTKERRENRVRFKMCLGIMSSTLLSDGP